MWDEIGALHRQGRDEKWWWRRARSEIVCECLKKVVPSRINILEIGAGYGAMTDMLQKFGTVTAVEPYADAVSYLKDTFHIETFQDTLESYTGTEKYDLVSCFDVLEHVENELRALEKIQSLIKDNGLLIVTVPAYTSLWSKQDEIDHHFRRYSRKELIKVISQNFIIKKATYFNTLLFPVAVIDKLLFARKKRSYSLEPNKFVNSILYAIFSTEKLITPLIDLPFGVSILVIAEKSNSHKHLV